MEQEVRVCARCILTADFPGIRFDERGICNYCAWHEDLEAEYPNQGSPSKKALEELVNKIKKSGTNKPYDCVTGISGGRDSTYMLFLAKQLGLRPLAVHFDNGWNSAIAARNIKNACEALDVDLYTHVANWEEFRNLQLSFLKASTSDAETPTDVAIMGVLFKAAAENDIKYILNGHSFRTEGLSPIEWTYMDSYYIHKVHKRFGSTKLDSVPLFGIWDYLINLVFRGIKLVPLINFVDYDHEKIDRILEEELGWEYYGGHHHESYYTKFFQSYLLPQKFSIDKRLLELSAKLRSGYITRNHALEEISKPYEFSEELIEYTINKLGLTHDEFMDILSLPVKSFRDYPSIYPLLHTFRKPIHMATKMGLISPLLYTKYLGMED